MRLLFFYLMDVSTLSHYLEPMHLLLIEDDLKLSEYLSQALVREGYTLDACSSIEDADAYLTSKISEPPNIVVLDRMLGRSDGATMIRRIKERFPNTGILILSSLDMPSEKARIIDEGADEYLSKPFSLDELTARLRLVARRSAKNVDSGQSAIRALGNLTLDLKTQNVTVGSLKVDLTRKEFQLLSLLMDSSGRVFNRYQILDRVWDIERTTESNVVETAVKNLRRKLEEAKCTARIESKRNVGYWIEVS
jgi:DNA-binding response OmpR family regulator